MNFSIRDLKGIGPRKEALFARLHLATVSNLLQYMPRDYEDRSHISAALTGRRTPRAFVPLRSTAGRRPLRAVQRTCPVGRLALRPPFIRRRFLPCSGAKHPARYAVRPPALS